MNKNQKISENITGRINESLPLASIVEIENLKVGKFLKIGRLKISFGTISLIVISIMIVLIVSLFSSKGQMIISLLKTIFQLLL
jgi:hypothetical protein